jgi:diguanylate cyclase (GGDEF)-like protein
VAGVLALLWDDAAVLHDESLRAVCELVAAQARVMLERLTLLAQLERVARTDELTALPNRRAWDEALPREMHRAVRSGEPLCVALLDLDHFKRYNDTFGHQTGDLLLSEVAHRWMRELRAEDILARYGGEEFAIALPACSVHHALEVMQRLNEVLPAGQSCSAGVAQWNGAESAGEVLERADQALYEAKRNGRNQAVVAPGPELAPA